MTLLCGENVSRRISEGRSGEREGNKGKQGKKEGKKKSGSKKRKLPAAEGTETDAGADTRTVRIQKSPEAFLPQDFC